MLAYYCNALYESNLQCAFLKNPRLLKTLSLPKKNKTRNSDHGFIFAPMNTIVNCFSHIPSMHRSACCCLFVKCLIFPSTHLAAHLQRPTNFALLQFHYYNVSSPSSQTWAFPSGRGGKNDPQGPKHLKNQKICFRKVPKGEEKVWLSALKRKHGKSTIFASFCVGDRNFTVQLLISSKVSSFKCRVKRCSQIQWKK